MTTSDDDWCDTCTGLNCLSCNIDQEPSGYEFDDENDEFDDENDEFDDDEDDEDELDDEDEAGE